MTVRRAFPLLALLVFASAVAALATGAIVPPGAAELSAHTAALTAPEMEGRASGTAGGEAAARYIADRLAAVGVRPAGDAGTFFQSFVVAPGTRLAPATELERVSPAPRTLELGREWTPHGGSMSREVTGRVIFVGYGVAAADGGYDDYAGVDVRGKIALALDDRPAPLAEPVSRLEKLILARRHGALALLLVGGPLPSLGATAAPVAIVSATLTRAGADALLAPAGRTTAALAARLAHTRAPGSFDTGVDLRVRVELAREDRRAANVVGIVPGTDPTLAAEAVVLGAHYDHLGRMGGAVHPGADDNASGTAVVIGLARAFAAAGGAPRTLVFALFAGEEMGLLGSSHYVREPGWPLERTVAMLNFDMVGRLRNDRLTIGGVETASGLRATVTDATRDTGLDLVLNDAPFAPSDHTRFYAAGAPVLFFHTGDHDDYHRPGDTADKLNAPGMARVAAIGARIAERLAAGPRPPYVTLAGPARGERAGGVRGGAFFGVAPDARAESDGVRLGGVIAGSAAARAGMRDGDVLVRFAGVPVNSFEELRKVIRDKRPGDTVTLVYLRDGGDHATSATLDARP